MGIKSLKSNKMMSWYEKYNELDKKVNLDVKATNALKCVLDKK